MAEQWSIGGDYVENCNCQVSCPCTMSLEFKPTSPDQSCHVTLGFNIRQGHYGNVDLGGLGAAVVLNTPPGQSMSQGNLSAALYLDDRASAEQANALQTILGGQAGGLFGALGPLIGNVLGVKKAEFQFGQDGKRRSLRIDGVTDFTIEQVPGSVNPDEPITLGNINIFNPAEPLLQAVVVSSSYRDHGLEWDNTGRNAYIAQFDLKGP
jgi:hypothetical protein